MNSNSNKCVLSQAEDNVAEAFAATQYATPTIASIVCAKLDDISKNENLKPINFPKIRLNSTFLEITTIVTMESWEKEEHTFDTEAMDTINLPDHRKLHIDPHIPPHEKVSMT